MSSHLAAEVVRARQLEIAASTAHAQHFHDLRIADGQPGRNRPSRIRRRAAVAAAGVCLALAGTGAATASARTGREVREAGTAQRLSSGQLQRRIDMLEAEGYAQVSCLVGATELYNAQKNRYVRVNWSRTSPTINN